jgi:DNA-directed RNA polymerase subunit RPC12/RpoP
MSEESDDLRHARLYISLDKDEMQNVIAEHKKADARRKAAIAYSASPEPVSFAPLPCVECGVSLTNQNHDNHFRCRHCVQREVGMTWTRAHRAIRHERKLKAAVGGAWTVLVYVVLAMAAAAGLGWVGATVAWHIGRLL